jgi:zinc transport system permease protein
MIPDFLIRALIGGFGVAAIAAPLGCFVLWRRMAFFGDALGHAALLGVALGFLIDVRPELGVLASSIAFAMLLVLLLRQPRLAGDATLAILSYGALALGFVVVGLMPGLRIDLATYLFGDILAVGKADLAWIYAGGTAILGCLAWLWRPLLAATLNEELAAAEGLRVERLSLVLMLLVAASVALLMKIVGVLLVTALMILPAAAARRFARTPEAMAMLAILFGALAVAGGLGASYGWDTPAGPSVVVAGAAIFALSLACGALRRAARRS